MLLRYLLADALSLLGNAIAAIALPWLILVRTGDAATAGLVAVASAAPLLVAALLGGALVDRYGRRRTSIAADVASTACVAALPLVDAAWGLTVTAFVVLGVAGALADVPGMTAREALALDVAVAAGVPLERLSGLREGVGGVVLVIGPAVAGGLLALLDPVAVLWVTAACSAAAALVTATLPPGVGPRPALVLVADRVPDDVRGRVLGLQNAASLGAAPVGLLGAGLLVGSVGPATTGMLVAGIWVAATVVAVTTPALRHLEASGADHR